MRATHTLSRRDLVIGLVAVFAVASVIYHVLTSPSTADRAAAATETTAHTPRPSPTSPTTRPTAVKTSPSQQQQPTDLPRLDHQGDGPLNCALRYATEDGGDAGWTAFASRSGVLEMRATTVNGRAYTKTWDVTTSHGQTVTVTTMSVPIPLTDLRALTATLTDVETAASYACLVGPAAR